MNIKERKELVKYYQALIQNDRLIEIRRKKDEKLKCLMVNTKYKRINAIIQA